MKTIRILLRTKFILLILIALVGCNADEYDQIRSENTGLLSQLKLLQEDLTSLRENEAELRNEERELSNLASNFENLQRKEEQIKMESSGVEDYRKDLTAALSTFEPMVAVWMEATQKSLEGTNLGSITLTSGEVLTGAQISKLDSERTILLHDQGQKELPLKDLPEPLRKKLLHEETLLIESQILSR